MNRDCSFYAAHWRDCLTVGIVPAQWCASCREYAHSSQYLQNQRRITEAMGVLDREAYSVDLATVPATVTPLDVYLARMHPVVNEFTAEDFAMLAMMGVAWEN